MDTQHLTLRLGAARDAQEIALMSRDLIETGLAWSWTRARVERQLRDPETTAVVACDRGRVIGFAVMTFADRHAHLNLLAVKPAYQRRGVGRFLVAWLEQSALAAGIGSTHLEVRARNHGARDFYRALGFQELLQLPSYYGGREPAVWMVRDIRARVSRRAT